MKITKREIDNLMINSLFNKTINTLTNDKEALQILITNNPNAALSGYAKKLLTK
jgi:hypothetical protein